MRAALLLLVLALVALPALAQDDPDNKTAGGSIPEGWHVRADGDKSAADLSLNFTDSTFNIVAGPAAIYHRADAVANGAYAVQATLTQNTAPRHPEAYGLFVGGTNLDNSKQDYLYFLIRQNGQYLVKHRAGSETHTLAAWTAHDAIHKPDAAGKATNTLGIVAGETAVKFMVNGVEVASFDRVPMLNTDGVYGLRINHNLDVQVKGFKMMKKG